MRKQKMNAAFVEELSATKWSTNKIDNQPDKITQTAIQLPYVNGVLSLLYTIQKQVLGIKNKMIQEIYASLQQQIMSVDEIIKDGSSVYPYNFTGSPHVFVTVPASQKGTVPIAEKAIVNATSIDKHRYHLQVIGHPGYKRINIYDEFDNLVLSEQINLETNFSRIYDLKWTKATNVSFEIVSNKIVARTAKI